MENERVFLTPGDCENNDTNSRRCEFDIKNEQLFFTPGAKPDIIFAGDSITHFMEAGQFYHKFGFIVNRGIGGDMANTLAWRFTADVTQLAPKLCIVLVGCNNLWFLEDCIDSETGDYKEEDQQKAVKIIVDSHIKMIEEARENGIEIWVGSLLPQGSQVGNHAIRNKIIKRVNNALEELCRDKDVTFLDYFSNMTKEDGLTLLDNTSREGIHPNHAGYELMRQILEPKLCEFFKER